jgi:hypothetical protein
MKCEICASDYSWCWTDTHGIAQCFRCGSPYRIYHYDESNNRISKPPELIVKPEYVALCRAYWETFKTRMPSGCSFPGGQELASEEQAIKFYEWMNAKSEASQTP